MGLLGMLQAVCLPEIGSVICEEDVYQITISTTRSQEELNKIISGQEPSAGLAVVLKECEFYASSSP
ncbi:hypothetical protein GHT09_000073 [Marmota monax]|uniref:Uncharacterized protein n=1 Tax=Marmota monax TaxID=9995 RepID=A0A834R086_MARMO|nr:hypothetical protein GHT09_000073 [Marmota monax]